MSLLGHGTRRRFWLGLALLVLAGLPLVGHAGGLITAWGGNSGGQNNVPPNVTNVLAIAAGTGFSLALKDDGTVAAWGLNSGGQLGDNTTTNRLLPVPVTTTGVLAGKAVVAIAAGDYHSLALCSGGSLAAWGANNYGQLGNTTTNNSLVPVAVDTSLLAATQRFTRVCSGNFAVHTLALVDGTPASGMSLTAAQRLGDGSFQLGFTNTPGAFFGVLGATNAALPLGNWTALGDATEVSPGQFQFTDPEATNSPGRFYRVRSP